MKALHALLIAAAVQLLVLCCVHTYSGSSVSAAVPSRFNRPIDDEALEEDWKDEEDEDWHEDTYDWREKMREKRRRRYKFDPNDMLSSIKAASGGMEIGFLALRPDLNMNIRDTWEQARVYRKLLKTNGVIAKFEAVHPGSIVVTNDDGDMFEIQQFLMKQPEVLKFRWKDQDYHPSGVTPTPTIEPKRPTVHPLDPKVKEDLVRKEKEKRAAKRAKKKAKKAKTAAPEEGKAGVEAGKAPEPEAAKAVDAHGAVAADRTGTEAMQVNEKASVAVEGVKAEAAGSSKGKTKTKGKTKAKGKTKGTKSSKGKGKGMGKGKNKGKTKTGGGAGSAAEAEVSSGGHTEL